MYLDKSQLAKLSDSALLACLEGIQSMLQAATEPNPAYVLSRDWQVAECVRRGLIGR